MLYIYPSLLRPPDVVKIKIKNKKVPPRERERVSREMDNIFTMHRVDWLGLLIVYWTCMINPWHSWKCRITTESTLQRLGLRSIEVYTASRQGMWFRWESTGYHGRC